MTDYIEDRLAINDLLTGWMHRDQSEWTELRELFHPDGTIEITWFTGLFSDFVDASIRMGASNVRTKHLIASPLVTFNGDRAIAETNAMIVAENRELGVGCATHNRFYDQIERRDGVWRIVNRGSIYDMGSFTFPTGVVELDQETVSKYPAEYAALAYVLEKSGFPVTKTFPTKGSELESDMKAAGAAWLAAAEPVSANLESGLRPALYNAA
ncbi:nuclear transport factor 2 family protein [Subtercola lobariae]|uniref:SnoaL-like domain-containing protein n=1 Tax=Subtercola lobariae TaxID=1588641 RepID=A0A917B4H9_9MICO|nr:nuclear transport factor 2 family protein [Subtercola lobariae]GGF21271.1 hypothetical protein GCM10011399_13680 [Subtercola lobariae]